MFDEQLTKAMSNTFELGKNTITTIPILKFRKNRIKTNNIPLYYLMNKLIYESDQPWEIFATDTTEMLKLKVCYTYMKLRMQYV